jgi:predicted dehydrogenase
VKLTILAPGHFHAALVQKKMYSDVEPLVHVYAPEGPDLRDYVQRIEGYNGRAENPTSWRLQIVAAPDFLERFIAEKAGDIVVIAGNNQRKTEYIGRAVEAGFHVLADKPMAIDLGGFGSLEHAAAIACDKNVLLHDIMTERYEIATLLQKQLSTIPSVFGELSQGSTEAPAIAKQSVHHFSKLVSGSPIKRPAWFFDVAQQGEGIVDVTTHLVDLVQWECFPDQIIDYRNDIQIISARRWPTEITPAQFKSVTGLNEFPAFLRKDVQGNNSLRTYANGEINYCIKGVHAKVCAIWNFAAPKGAGDTHFSIMRGTQSSLVIRQGKAERYQPVLYVEPPEQTDLAVFERALSHALLQLRQKYPGVDIKRSRTGWQVIVPTSYHVGHEAHFAQVTDQFLAYVKSGSLPDWETPNVLAKHYTTTTALAKAETSEIISCD